MPAPISGFMQLHILADPTCFTTDYDIAACYLDYSRKKREEGYRTPAIEIAPAGRIKLLNAIGRLPGVTRVRSPVAGFEGVKLACPHQIHHSRHISAERWRPW